MHFLQNDYTARSVSVVTLIENTPKDSVTTFSLMANRALKTLSLYPYISCYQVQISLKTLKNESCLAMLPSGQSSVRCTYRNKLPSSLKRQTAHIHNLS